MGGCGKRMCSRGKSGGNLCLQRAQAAPVAAPKIKRKIETPENYGRTGGQAAVEPLLESTIPFVDGFQAARRRSTGSAACASKGVAAPGLVV